MMLCAKEVAAASVAGNGLQQTQQLMFVSVLRFGVGQTVADDERTFVVDLFDEGGAASIR